jgi:hypothetical protein
MNPDLDRELRHRLIALGIDTNLSPQDLRRALLAAIAESGGQVTWTHDIVMRPRGAFVDEIGVVVATTEVREWRVDLLVPFGQVFRARTLEDALAQCLVVLRDRVQVFYREVTAFIARLRAAGSSDWANRLDASMAGATGGEVLGGLRHELHDLLGSDAILEERDRRWLASAIQEVNEFLGPSMPDREKS